jgi:biotin transport system substrate-specific component
MERFAFTQRIFFGILPCLLGVVLLAFFAQLELGTLGSPVPTSGQSLGVVLVGGWLGAKRGPLAVALYLLAGALGLPVFAGGSAGWQKLFGPTGGYLFGFVAGAWVVGAITRRHRRAPMVFAAALLGHGVLLAAGGSWLAWTLGPLSAWQQGVEPFLAGAFLKSFLATLCLLPHYRRIERWTRKNQESAEG